MRVNIPETQPAQFVSAPGGGSRTVAGHRTRDGRRDEGTGAGGERGVLEEVTTIHVTGRAALAWP